MITIYHHPRTRSIRLVWLMEELDEEYRVEPVTIPVPPEYLAVNPTCLLYTSPSPRDS